MHHQEDTGDDLDHQHQQRQRAEEVPEVEVLGGVVLGQVALDGRRQREARVDPVDNRLGILAHRLGLSVFADQDLGVAQVLVRRDLEVVRRRLALVDAARHVEGGTVAGAQEATRPVGGDAATPGAQPVAAAITRYG